jgi:catechol 2,3-dioxygenase-like lactoylglutathione lyase family enzyme
VCVPPCGGIEILYSWTRIKPRKGQARSMTKQLTPSPVLELRVALTAREYERMVKFYCDGLGLETTQTWPADQGRAVILDLGRATLEIFDEKQADTVDQLEAGRRVSGQIRFALQVPDLASAMGRLLANGATLVHPPVTTPWGDYNVRLQDPDGIQVTLFQPLKK